MYRDIYRKYTTFCKKFTRKFGIKFFGDPNFENKEPTFYKWQKCDRQSPRMALQIKTLWYRDDRSQSTSDTDTRNSSNPFARIGWIVHHSPLSLECVHFTLRNPDHYTHCHFHLPNFSVWPSSFCGGVFCVVQSCELYGSDGGGVSRPVALAALLSVSVLSEEG